VRSHCHVLQHLEQARPVTPHFNGPIREGNTMKQHIYEKQNKNVFLILNIYKNEIQFLFIFIWKPFFATFDELFVTWYISVL
jgi:hypothetical protein